MLENFNPQQIQTVEGAREAIVHLLNLVEEMKQENLKLRETIQNLRDENNHLKGEQGKPKIKASKKAGDHSSEKERKEGKKPRKRHKRKYQKEIPLAKRKQFQMASVSQTTLCVAPSR